MALTQPSSGMWGTWDYFIFQEEDSMADRFVPKLPAAQKDLLKTTVAENAATDDIIDVEFLMDWCDSRGYLVELGVERGIYQASIRQRRGKIRRHLGWGHAITAADAVGMAIVHVLYDDRRCKTCFGFGERITNGETCPSCGGTGLTEEQEHAALQ